MEKTFAVTFVSDEVSTFTGKLYAQIKQVASRIAGAVSYHKKSATVEYLPSNKQAVEFYALGNLITGIELVPMEEFEMKFNPMYKKDENGISEIVGNRAKPLCTMIEVGTAKVIGTLSDDELKTAK